MFQKILRIPSINYDIDRFIALSKKKEKTFLLVSVFGSHALDKRIADRLTTI